MNRGKLYESLFDAYKKAYPDRPKVNLQNDCNTFWAEAKKECGKDDSSFDAKISAKVKELLVRGTNKKVKGLFSYFTIHSANVKTATHAPATITAPAAPTSQLTVSDTPKKCDIGDSENEKRRTPSQDVYQTMIANLQAKICTLRNEIDSGLACDDSSKELESLKKELNSEKNALKRKQSNAALPKTCRKKKQQKLDEICSEHPDISKQLKSRDASGRPRTEEEQPGLLKAICDLAMFGGGAQVRRQSEQVRSCKTLDDLKDALEKAGFHLSRSGLYLRLHPRHSDTLEGKSSNFCTVKLENMRILLYLICL